MPTAAAPKKVKISPARRVLQVLLIVLPPFTAALLKSLLMANFSCFLQLVSIFNSEILV